MSALWECRNASWRYEGAPADAVRDVSLDIKEGRITALIGPNGAGKSTLLQLILGLLHPFAGQIAFRSRDIREWTRPRLALEIAVVPQGEAEPLFSVREIVGMGRYARLGPWQRERDEDIDAIDRAMERCDVSRFADRWLTTLSGGERQRVRLARALAQEAPTLVLDEPTTFLDIRHEMTMFALLRELRSEGVTVVIATHNLNLASRFADDVVLMNRGAIEANGAPSEVVTAARVAAVYEWPVTIVAHQDGAPQVVPAERQSI
jgi:iron complex transport system ATP-binding protein